MTTNNPEDRFDLVIVDHVERLFPELLADLTEYGCCGSKPKCGKSQKWTRM